MPALVTFVNPLDRLSVLDVPRIVAGGNDLRVGAKLGLLTEEALG